MPFLSQDLKISKFLLYHIYGYLLTDHISTTFDTMLSNGNCEDYVCVCVCDCGQVVLFNTEANSYTSQT